MGGLGAPMPGSQPAEEQEEDQNEPQLKDQPRTMFRVAINHGQQGLAYLILDEGYTLMHAMQDAMDEKKFQLCLTLL